MDALRKFGVTVWLATQSLPAKYGGTGLVAGSAGAPPPDSLSAAGWQPVKDPRPDLLSMSLAPVQIPPDLYGRLWLLEQWQAEANEGGSAEGEGDEQTTT